MLLSVRWVACGRALTADAGNGRLYYAAGEQICYTLIYYDYYSCTSFNTSDSPFSQIIIGIYLLSDTMSAYRNPTPFTRHTTRDTAHRRGQAVCQLHN